jgi:hypothetical protein
MSNDLHITAIPSIKLNEARKQTWDRICDELDFDDSELKYSYDDLDSTIQMMKDLKKWYSLEYFHYNYCWKRCIAGINIIMLAHDDYSEESDDVKNASNIENFKQLYDWLGQEAKEDARMATVLDLTKAEKFIEDEDSVNLPEMTSITEEAAKMLSTYGGEINLSGLTDLSEKAAEALSEGEYEGEWIPLDGLTDLSTATAEALSKYKGYLSLNGLTELSDAAAEALSKNQGGLSLNCLTELSDAAAEALSKNQGGLYLDGLTELSDVAAKALSKHQGDFLWLNGLTELSDEAAAALRTKVGTICEEDPEEWVASLQNKGED